jgi:hypothetical protein
MMPLTHECRSTPPGYGIPGGLPHGEALDRAADPLGASWGLPCLWHDAALALGLRRADLCAVSPAR